MAAANLKERWEEVCNDYLKAFIKKQGYDLDFWAGDDIGGVACFCHHYFFNMDDIRYDIDNKCKKGLIFQWQEDSVTAHMEDPYTPTMNYRSWVMGARYKDMGN